MKIAVIDTGLGIKEEAIGSLFKNFGYIDDEAGQKLNSKGIGLGLSISKKIVDMLGGEMKVDSVYGEGSEFSFTIKVLQNTFKKHKNLYKTNSFDYDDI